MIHGHNGNGSNLSYDLPVLLTYPYSPLGTHAPWLFLVNSPLVARSQITINYKVVSSHTVKFEGHEYRKYPIDRFLHVVRLCHRTFHVSFRAGILALSQAYDEVTDEVCLDRRSPVLSRAGDATLAQSILAIFVDRPG